MVEIDGSHGRSLTATWKEGTSTFAANGLAEVSKAARSQSPSSTAALAASFEQHLGDGRHGGPFAAGRGADADRDVVQAGDFAAIEAEEMRVLRVVLRSLAAPLEAPHMVPQFEPGKDAGLGQLHEVAVDGGLVVAQRAQPRCDVGVAQGAPCLAQLAEHRDASGGP